MSATEQIAGDILDIFKKYGHQNYGEGCSMLSHSVQAGIIAKEKEYSETLILSAFLHDIGHLIPLEEKEKQPIGDNWGIENHEGLGAKYLRQKGFSEAVVIPVEYHVAAKRYLCYINEKYHDQLSLASKKTLEYQGGPMKEKEALEFERTLFFEESIKVRLLDDLAKETDFNIANEHWSYFNDLIIRVLADKNF